MIAQYQNSQWADNGLPALVPASFHDSDEEDIENHIPFDIHQYFGLSPGTPICLDSLADPTPGQKPAYTYATLVKLAIWSSPQRRLTLSGIYQALQNRFEWFKDCENPNAWKTSIRHSLSLLSVFVKLPMDIHLPGKGHYWTVDFTKGDGYKRPRKRGKKQPKGDPDDPASAPSSSTQPHASHAHETRRRQLPKKSSSIWEANAHEWQSSSERTSRVYMPYGKTASPEPQFRHYRMCTYLYPEPEGSRPSSSATRTWNVADQEKNGKNQDEQAHGPKRSWHPAQIGSDPFMGASAQDATVSNGQRPPSQMTDDYEHDDGGEYFHPSPASYQAYHAASSASQNMYSWDANDGPISKARAHSEGGSTMHSGDYEIEEDDDLGENQTSMNSTGTDTATASEVTDPPRHPTASSSNSNDLSSLEGSPSAASAGSEMEEDEEI
ncbi:hypothetical protein M0805_002551 [Coniferiporia weirii]|nr:hypothetical protein M0805_002551 [Coniferiporia weirii]